MQFYIDSSDIDEIGDILSSGMLSGVTTNPSLLRDAVEKHGVVDMEEYLHNLLNLVGKPVNVSLQVTGKDPSAEGMILEGRRLYERFNVGNNNVVIKIPVNPSFSAENKHFGQGLRAIRTLAADGIPVNVTLIERVEQAVLAAGAGAKFVSPFVGRIDDYLRERTGNPFDKWAYFPVGGIRDDHAKSVNDDGICSGVGLVERIIGEFEMRDLGRDTKVLAASVRNVRQAHELYKLGPSILTLPYQVFKEFLEDVSVSLAHPKTLEGAIKLISIQSRTGGV